MNTAFPLTTPGTHMAKTKSTVWQALLEVPGRMSQEPRLLSGVGLRILGQGLAQAPLCSALPAWGRPGLNLQGNLHLGPGRAGIHAAALRTSRSAREGVRVRGTKLGWRQGRGYLLSGSSRAWNLQEQKSSDFTKAGLAAAWPCPPPHLWANAPSTAPRVAAGASVRPGEQCTGFRPRAQGLTSQRQPENEGITSLPATRSPQHTGPPPQPTHSHTRTGVVQDGRAPQLEPKTLLLGRKLVRGC